MLNWQVRLNILAVFQITRDKRSKQADDTFDRDKVSKRLIIYLRSASRKGSNGLVLAVP